MLKKLGFEDSKSTKTPMSTEIKLTKDDQADSWIALNIKKQTTLDIFTTEVEYVSTGKARQQALWMKQALINYGIRLDDVPIMDIYRALKSGYVHKGRTIDPSFYNDLSDDSVAKFIAIGFDCLLSLDDEIFPRGMYLFRDQKDKVLPYGMILTRLFKNLKANIAQDPFDERYKLFPRKISSLKAKQPKNPPPKRTIRKSKRTQLSTSSSTESPSSNNGDLPSIKLSPRSYSKALKDDPNISMEQRETRGMFKNMGQALQKFARLLKKGWSAIIFLSFRQNLVFSRVVMFEAITSQSEPKVQKDYKSEYKKIKAKLALLEIHITMKKVNILLSMDEDSDWQNYLKYININLKYVEEERLNLLSKYYKIVFELNKFRDDLLALKQAKLDVVTFQIQNTKLTKLNHALQDKLKEERRVNEKWLNSSKKVSQCIIEQIPSQKKKNLGGEQLTETSLDYDHEMVPKSKDWVKRLNPDNKLPNFNTGKILVHESQAVNESLQHTEAPTVTKSLKDSCSESQTPLTLLKYLQSFFKL
nr:retrovirus-related Pol polyprotein from transposon TNT 1-94 [Tanacetum cinerariifolium]